MRKYPWTFAVLATALLSGCAAQPQKVTAPQPLELNTFARKWSTEVPMGHGAIIAVHVREDMVFAYSRDGTSSVFDRNSGRMLHTETIAGGTDVLHEPVLLKETIVYPTLTALQIYDRKSGQFNRTAKLPFAVRTNAVGAKNMLFLGADYPGGGRVVALDLTREYVPVRWELMFPGSNVSAAPAYFNDSVYTAAGDGTVTAIAADTREPLWPLPNGVFQTGGPVQGALVAEESGVYVSSVDSKLYCLNRTSGKIKWQYIAGSELRKGPIVSKDLVFQIVPGTGLVAIDKLEGVSKTHPPAYFRKHRWVVENATQFLAEDDKFVYLRRADDAILAANKIDGTIAFTSKRKDFRAFGINTKDGTVFAGTKDGRLMAIASVTQPGRVGEVVLNEPPAAEAEHIALATGQ